MQEIIPPFNNKMLLNQENVNKVGNKLVIEAIPKDQTMIRLPKNGDRIEVFGAWVTDKLHNGTDYIQYGRFSY